MMIVACATDDGKNFMTRHFGDALQYRIYKWNGTDFNYIKTISNSSEEEEGHGDPKKAKQIMELLIEANVNVGLTKIFGPNINRIKSQFVPVLISTDNIESGLAILKKNIEEVSKAILLTENRIHIDLRKSI
jgi:predicted Fe-Mo cluster-binding NifX family protein